MVGQKLPDSLQAQGADAKTYHLVDHSGAAVILEWTSPKCPYTAYHYDTGLMQQRQQEALKKGVRWYSISSSAPGTEGYLSAKSALALQDKRSMRISGFLLDYDGVLAHLFGAVTTPHIVMIDGDGTYVYSGAPDSNPFPHPTRRPLHDYVTEGLEALADREPLPHAVTRAYGCKIDFSPQEK